jgi:hypothetical protein
MANQSDSDFMYNWIREKSGKKTNMENHYEDKTTTISTEEIMKRRTTLITVSEEDILSMSNDADLGALVRKRYWESK